MKKLLLILCLPFLFFFPVTAEEKHKVSIIIDDFGNDMKGTEEMLSLPIPLTAAVMPFLPSTKADAKLAHDRGYEVIIHMPMEAIHGKKSWLGPYPLTTDLSDTEIRKRVEMAIKDVPFAIGMNNHMGSKITADERVMKIVLTICKEHGLFYVDSGTSPKSVVKKIADQLGVPTIKNNLFFDGVHTHTHISKQAQLLLQKVKEEPVMVAIGHVGSPGTITAAAIAHSIPALKREADFVFVSTLVKTKEVTPHIR